MTDQRDSLAREIDEELRREQLLKLWERYGTYLIAGAVLIIAGIGGFKYYEHRRIEAAEAAGARFTAATREASPDKKAEVQRSREWVCACDEMKQWKYCHCLLFVTPEGLPITEHLPEDHEGRQIYGLVKDPTPDKGREARFKVEGDSDE